MLTLLKKAGLVPLLLGYFCTSWLISIFPVSGSVLRALRVRNTTVFSRLALALFGIQVRIKHRERLRAGRAAKLVVSNHVSYIDILVLSAIKPCVFITSVELRNTPLLGMLAGMGGSLFVERRKPTGLKREIEAIARVLGQGFSVVLFPEGTTSDGKRVQQFKNPFFDAAVSARKDILPLCLRYTRINGGPVNDANRNALYYHGGASFRDHFPAFLSLRSVDVEVTPLGSIKPDPTATRKELASSAYAAISSAYHV